MNKYLTGNYAPVIDEITATDLQIIGTLPPELNGRYLRNGPNPIGDVDPQKHHWFIGDGMVHGVCLRDGEAKWYRNRYVGSQDVSKKLKRPEISGPNWNNNPSGPNTNVGGFAGTTWAMVEAGGVPVELSYELESIARNDFYGTLPGAFTAHPKIDPSTGDMHAVVYAWAEWMDHVQYVHVGSDGRVKRTVDIALPGMSMVHDMSLTEKYVVIYDQPCTVDFDLAAVSPFPFKWNPDYGNRVGFMPRDGAAQDIVWVDVPLGYTFHPMNAYDDGDFVVLDAARHPKMFDRERRGPSEGSPTLDRWRINTVTGKVKQERIDDRPQEFPRINESLIGLPNKFGYTAGVGKHFAQDTLIKIDLESHRIEARTDTARYGYGEPVFIPRDGATAEDDGWIMALRLDTETQTSDLALFDATAITADPVAVVHLPARVPNGFHGNWIPGAQ